MQVQFESNYLLVEKSLIGTVIIPLGPDERILESPEPGFLPLLPDVWPVQFAAPTAAQDCRAVVRVIPHEMEVLVRLEPLGDRGYFAVVQSAVEVTRDVCVNLLGQRHRHLKGIDCLLAIVGMPAGWCWLWSQIKTLAPHRWPKWVQWLLGT